MRLAPFFVMGLSTVLLSTPNALTQVANLQETGTSPVETKFIPNGQIRMALCPSSVHLIGRDDELLRVSYDAGLRKNDDVRIRIQVDGEKAGIRVTGCPHNNFELTVEVPKSSNLYARMFAGEMQVSGINGDQDVELHAGQLTLELGKPEEYSHVDASVLSGDIEAAAFNISKGGLFRSFDRSGPGKYRVHAHVGAGQLELR
jgi:hypothetical protein